MAASRVKAPTQTPQAHALKAKSARAQRRGAGRNVVDNEDEDLKVVVSVAAHGTDPQPTRHLLPLLLATDRASFVRCAQSSVCRGRR
jgi:hypothetical protein